MNNAEWMIKNNMKFSKLSWGHINGKNIVYYRNDNAINELYAEEFVKPENLITKWLDMEHQEPILDDVERQYLSAVIKPFRDRVQCIVKAYKGYYIFIKFNDESHDMDFPIFNRETMYKGMTPDKEYTLEELGL